MLGPGWKRWARIATWVTFVVVFAVALFLLGTGIAGAVRSSDLDERGVEVPAEVLDVSVDPGDEGGPSSDVTVRFKVRGDERVLTTAVVSYGGDFEDDHPRARRNGTRIEYDPQDPEKARIVGESGDWLDRIIAGVVFTILIPVMAVIYRRHPDILGL